MKTDQNKIYLITLLQPFPNLRGYVKKNFVSFRVLFVYTRLKFPSLVADLLPRITHLSQPREPP
jgi:hypothetical protein